MIKTILTDEDLLERNRIGQPLVNPFRKEQLTPNGYDLNIKEVRIHKTIQLLTDKPITIPKNTHFEVMSEERIECLNDICASLWIRHSYSKRGVFASFGKVDAGFCGNLNINFYTTDEDIILDSKKKTICQIVFEKLDKIPIATYGQRSGNYQNQRSLL